MKWKKSLSALIMVICLLLSTSGCYSRERVKKPIIYLYPEEEMTVSVKLSLDGRLTYTWPISQDGSWEVTAKPSGVLTDHEGREYSYIFWEADTTAVYDFSKGFCIAGEDTADFLRDTLSKIGLTAKEYNEFIVFWLPQMQDNKYNLISFQSDAYTDSAQLDISPKPDSMLRVFMAWKPVEHMIDIEPQDFDTFQRNGFTVVEWGGCEVS